MSDFKLAAVFSDNMVLQAHKPIAIFGTGEQGATVTASLGNNSVSTTVNGDSWRLFIPAMDYEQNLTLAASCDTPGAVEYEFINIAVGEVWLAGGQSNMEFELQSCPQGCDALKNDDSRRIRYYYVQKNMLTDENFYRDEADSEWEEWGGDCNPYWSAVAYFFAKNLSVHIDAVIGIIGCNWGATSASAWMSRDSLAEDADFKREYLDVHKTPDYEQNIPCALYESMLMRVCPYSVAGVIWYQGEGDCYKAELYYRLFSRLIALWRSDWGEPNLPFLFCQLTMHLFKGETDWKDWAVLREAQAQVARDVDGAEMAVIIDLGEFDNIHPNDKKTVGERLALLALKTVYDRDCEAFAPQYESHKITGSGLEISFSNTGGGLVLKNSGIITGFEGLNAEIIADKILINSLPSEVRYLWTNYADNVSIYGKNGLPLAPFRFNVHNHASI
jgi:sialate O-acetylesterase